MAVKIQDGCYFMSKKAYIETLSNGNLFHSGFLKTYIVRNLIERFIELWLSIIWLVVSVTVRTISIWPPNL